MKTEIILTCECDEPEGCVTRHVWSVPLTIPRLRGYWEKLSQFPTLYGRRGENTVDEFINTFLSMNNSGEVQANALVWEVDDVGIMYITDIYPEYQANIHLVFWDRRFKGRRGLMREMLRYVMEELSFHRLVAEIPLHSPSLFKMAEHVGFVREGRLRKAAWYRREWWDVNIYSVLREEVLEDGRTAEAGHRVEVGGLAGNPVGGGLS